MARSGLDWIREADGESPASATIRGMAGAILAFFGGVILVIESAFEGLTELLDVFSAARDFLVTLISSPAMVIEGAAGETVRSITVGEWAFFGPMTLAVGVGSVALAWWVWSVLDPEIPIVDDLLPWR